ncbi:hypothetical protein SAMN05444273_1183 [Litoreibacter ascidiaceicola]|uniref:Uncharacterized protein n=1 Tax=Litoreibacter ascidiaceicola TaxID=1486859 RepID=A0A1M5EZI6_9RHOB|nr:hypothetical protein [Litoreibacter ascidiaceicola]SHF84586.1 hypothetical protein SAMN05444273_1183 [Litoreibacter ascidiaceicola]
MIYYDKFQTWEKSFGDLLVRLVGEEALNDLSSSNFEFIEDAGDFVVSRSDITTVSHEIQGWLLAQEFCVFHGTRLLSEEILSVQQKGLRPLVAADREQRLREILGRHRRWASVEDKLLEVIEDVGPKEKQGRRQGQVHFSLSRSGLVNGFDHYLTHGSEFDQHVVQRLFGDQSGLELLSSETVPVLVHVSISGEQLIQGAHPHFTYSDVVGMGEIPGTARTFLNSWAFKAANPGFDIEKLRTDCCVMERVATPPERILTIERLDDLAAH